MTDPSALYHVSRLAAGHARSKGEDTSQLRMISGVLLAIVGVQMALSAFNAIQAKQGGTTMGGRGR